jgi:hypothetical protein
MQSIMAELEAMQRSNCPRHQAALLSEAMGWVAAAVASRREANLHRHEESFERVDEMLRDPSFKRQYTQTFVGRYTRWVETVVAVAYADHSGSTDQALGGYVAPSDTHPCALVLLVQARRRPSRRALGSPQLGCRAQPGTLPARTSPQGSSTHKGFHAPCRIMRAVEPTQGNP